MNWEAITGIGEVIGVFAVLATLVYLAIQIQQSKSTAISEVTRAVLADFQIIWSTLGDDPEKTRLIRIAVNDWEVLSKNEQLIAHSFFINLIVHYSSALEQKEKLPELSIFIQAWEDNILGLVQCAGGRKWFDTCNYLFLASVQHRLKERLANIETLPPPWTDTLPWWRIDNAEIKSTV